MSLLFHLVLKTDLSNLIVWKTVDGSLFMPSSKCSWISNAWSIPNELLKWTTDTFLSAIFVPRNDCLYLNEFLMIVWKPINAIIKMYMDLQCLINTKWAIKLDYRTHFYLLYLYKEMTVSTLMSFWWSYGSLLTPVNAWSIPNEQVKWTIHFICHTCICIKKWMSLPWWVSDDCMEAC